MRELNGNTGDRVAQTVGVFRKTLQWTGVDRAIGFTLASRVWQLAATSITLVLILRYLSPEEQGFYYTFQSILGLQVLVELGLGGVLMQFVSHEWAGLYFGANRRVEGDELCRDRFASLVRLGARWFAVGAVLVFLLCYFVGSFFFRSQPHPKVTWQGPWFVLILSASALIGLSPFFPILEGCHKVAEVAMIRFGASVVAAAVAWAALYSRLALYAPALMSVATLGVYSVYIFGRYRSLLRLGWLGKKNAVQGVRWRAEFWPMQWRTALTWCVGYLMWQLFTPVLFYYWGAVVAGQMGITMSIALGLHTVCLTWMMTKAPALGTLQARRHTREMRELFRVTITQSVWIYIILAFAGLMGLAGVFSVYPLVSARFLSLRLFGLLLISFGLTLVCGDMAIFLRAFKEEPLVWVNVITGLLVGSCIWQLGQRWGAPAMVLSLLFGNAFLAFPWTVVIWRRKWAAMPSAAALRS